MKTNMLKTAALVAVACSALLCGGCDNANPNPQLSHATSECDKHEGTILYAGCSFEIIRVNINGTNYLCNTKGGIIRE